MGEFASFLQNNLADFWTYTGFHNATLQHVVMILVGIFFIYLAVAKEFEPMLLIPIGFGILIGNIPFNMEAGLKVGLYEEGSVLNILYQGVTSEADADWGGSTVWYLWCIHDCLGLGLRPDAGRSYRYHWWCRRSDRYLPFVQVGT